MPATAADSRRWIVFVQFSDRRNRAVRKGVLSVLERGRYAGELALSRLILRGHLHTQRVANFLGNLHQIERFLRNHDEAFMAKVYRDRVEMWLSHEEWRKKVGLSEPGEDDEP